MAKRSFSHIGAGGEWDEFFERVGSRLIGSLVLFSGDRSLAEECAQEAFARAFERWDRVRTFESPDAWVYRTALNLARSSIRRTAMERQNQHRLITPAPLPDSATAIAVRDAVGRLPARHRAVIVARFYLGLDVAQTARALGCREGTVKAHTFKALRRLRTEGLIDDEEGDRAKSS